MRQITGEQGPRVVAFDLLKEITRPALSNLKVQFHGLRVARVYPEQLPNLPAGSQQILLGRYLPQGADQSGEIVVTGRQGDRDIKFKRTVSMKNAEEGNSFLPRLWARMHLDHLLQQGPSQAIKDDIIALSEEYHIITPYTSLLVLESDADRERFKVKRNFQMRDGEKFFAEGRDNADFELVQQQMKRAGGWRLELRKAVLQQLSGLGRDANVIPEERVYPVADLVVPSAVALRFSTGSRRLERFDWRNADGATNEFWDSSADFDSRIDLITRTIKPESWEEDSSEIMSPTFSYVSSSEKVSLGRETQSLQMMVTPKIRIQQEEEDYLGDSPADASETLSFLGCSTVRGFQTLGRSYNRLRGATSPVACEPCYTICKPVYESGARIRHSAQEELLVQLFGELPSAGEVKQPSARKNDWPEEVRTISKNLRRTAQLQLPDGGLKIENETEAFDPRFGKLTEKYHDTFITGAKSWLLNSTNDGEQMTIQWCDGRERGIINAAFQLGRMRDAVAEDLKSPPWDDYGFELQPLGYSFGNQKVAVEHPAADQALSDLHRTRQRKKRIPGARRYKAECRALDRISPGW